MFKKFSAVLLVFIILTVASIGAYAIPTDGSDITTQPPFNIGVQLNGISDKSAVTSESIVDDKSNAASASDIVDESVATTASAISARKTEFEKILKNVLKDANAVNNELDIVEITSPKKVEYSIYENEKLCILSGNSKYSDVVITIAKYNTDIKEYESMYSKDGKSSWEVGDFRSFWEVIMLTKGTNKIKILAYRTSQIEEAKLDNIQVNCFKIEVLKETIYNKVIKKTVELGNEISNSLGIGDIFKK